MSNLNANLLVIDQSVSCGGFGLDIEKSLARLADVAECLASDITTKDFDGLSQNFLKTMLGTTLTALSAALAEQSAWNLKLKEWATE